MARQEPRKSPLKSKPVRTPGQSLDEQRRELFDDYLLLPAFLVAGVLMVCIVQWHALLTGQPPQPWLWTAALVLAIGFVIYRFLKILPVVRKLRQGADGERAVGQYLEGLREQGYKVFHDIVADGFNLDHVAIGPGGVFTIETKTWSKPVRGESVIHFNGSEIKVLEGPADRRPVIQAKAQAAWLKALLEESTGVAPEVRPVVVFPGWYIKDSASARAKIWVLNPKALPKFLIKATPRLDAETVNLLSYHLSRYIRAQEGELERERRSFWRAARKRPLPE